MDKSSSSGFPPTPLSVLSKQKLLPQQVHLYSSHYSLPRPTSHLPRFIFKFFRHGDAPPHPPMPSELPQGSKRTQKWSPVLLTTRSSRPQGEEAETQRRSNPNRCSRITQVPGTATRQEPPPPDTKRAKYQRRGARRPREGKPTTTPERSSWLEAYGSRMETPCPHTAGAARASRGKHPDQNL